MVQELEQLRLEYERTRHESEYLRSILESMPDPVFVQGREGRFELVNRALCERVGLQPDELLGASADDVLPAGRGYIFHELCQQVLETRRPLRSENLFAGTDESHEVTLETLIAPLIDGRDEHRGVVAVGRDVTERVRVCRAIEEARTRALAASRAKTDFLARMSHEIRTPLNAILGYSQLLSGRISVSNLPPDVREFLANINTSGYNLAGIVDNVLELSRIEEGKVAVADESLALAGLVERVYDVCKVQALHKGVEFAFHHDPGLPRTIRSDGTRVTQILNNLVSNAIKFTPTGKRVDLRVEQVEDRLRFLVVDQGIGIAADQQAAIFEPFEQGDPSIPLTYGGTGLGLAICKHLAHLLGGRISLESQPRHGSTFTFEMALVCDDAAAPATVSDPERTTPRFDPATRVLVIEDNLLSQQVVRTLLEELGVEVHVADNGEAGVAMAVEMMPHCIFMDLHMPRMDGLQATRTLRQLDDFAHVPIIALSADAFVEQKDTAFQAGITDYLTKPIMLDRLVYKLREHLPTSDAALPLSLVERSALMEYSQARLCDLGDGFIAAVPRDIDHLWRLADNRSQAEMASVAERLARHGEKAHAPRFVGLCVELAERTGHSGWGHIIELVQAIETTYALTASALRELAREPGQRPARP